MIIPNVNKEVEDSASWIPIANDLINENWIPVLHNKGVKESGIGVLGLSLLCQLMILADKKDYCYITLTMLKDIMDLDEHIRTVKEYIDLLEKQNYIKITNVTEEKKETPINKNTTLKIDIPYKIWSLDKTLNKNGYFRMPVDAFKMFKKLKHYGWSILCMLCVRYNIKYKYAYPTYDQIEKALGISDKTVHEYLEILIKERAIAIWNGKRTLIEEDENGKKSNRKENNKYKISFILKYYEIFKKNEEKYSSSKTTTANKRQKTSSDFRRQL